MREADIKGIIKYINKIKNDGWIHSIYNRKAYAWNRAERSGGANTMTTEEYKECIKKILENVDDEKKLRLIFCFMHGVFIGARWIIRNILQ